MQWSRFMQLYITPHKAWALPKIQYTKSKTSTQSLLVPNYSLGKYKTSYHWRKNSPLPSLVSTDTFEQILAKFRNKLCSWKCSLLFITDSPLFLILIARCIVGGRKSWQHSRLMRRDVKNYSCIKRDRCMKRDAWSSVWSRLIVTYHGINRKSCITYRRVTEVKQCITKLST